jgi:hypothetical protein
MKVALNIKVFTIIILLYKFYLKKYYINFINIIYTYIKLKEMAQKENNRVTKVFDKIGGGWVKKITQTASAVKNSWQGKY